MGNCTLGHSEHRHGLDAAWETERASRLTYFQGLATAGQCLPSQKAATGGQLLRPGSVMPTNQTRHGKRRQAGQSLLPRALPRHLDTLQPPPGFQHEPERFHSESKGIVLCLLHPLNRTGEAPEAQRTEGRTPRRPSPSRRLYTCRVAWRAGTWTDFCYTADPPGPFSWS